MRIAEYKPPPEPYGHYGFKLWLGILPGWNWLNNHEHDLDGYEPRFELVRPGFKCSVQLKDNRKLKEIVREVIHG